MATKKRGAKKVTEKQAEATISVDSIDNRKKETVPLDGVRQLLVGEPLDLEGDTANVNINASYTFSEALPAYESLRISVSLTLPCCVDNIDQVADFARKWVEDQMNTTADLYLPEG